MVSDPPGLPKPARHRSHGPRPPALSQFSFATGKILQLRPTPDLVFHRQIADSHQNSLSYPKDGIPRLLQQVSCPDRSGTPASPELTISTSGARMAHEKLLAWATGRLPWEQDALRRLATQGELTANDLLALRCPPPGREPLPGRARPFATLLQRRAGADSPPLPSRLRPRYRRGRFHAHLSPAITAPPPTFESRLPLGYSACMTFRAVTKRREICDSPHVPTNVPSRAELESPRARVPHMAGCSFSPSPVLRPNAPRSKKTRSLAAYRHRTSLARNNATIV